MSDLLNLILNKDLTLPQGLAFAAIIGETPSKGARSPLLWNKVYQQLKTDVRMVPLDVPKGTLKEVMSVLRKNSFYMGGAVTMPYKIEVLGYLDHLEEQAKIIGAVNCIYRRDGKLIGANTDGDGALWSLKEMCGPSLAGKKILVVGLGGAGLAVATYCAQAIGPQGTLILANRSLGGIEHIGSKLRKYCHVKPILHWPLQVSDVQGVDIVVNCTNLGFAHHPDLAMREQSIFGDISQDILSTIKQGVIFDIIYQPLETPLLRQANMMGLKTLNGLGMNLEQAVIAFDKVNTAVGLFKGDRAFIRTTMSQQ